jgi:hypothetical protein
MKPEHREPGIIESAREEDWRGEGQPPNTVNLMIKFQGSGQGFGGLQLSDNKMRRAFVDALCDTFAVHKLELLVGLPCVALRNFSTWNSSIVGIESVETGRVFLVRDFQREVCGMKVKDPLEEAQDDLRRSISRCYSDIDRFTRELQTIGNDYAAHHKD